MWFGVLDRSKGVTCGQGMPGAPHVSREGFLPGTRVDFELPDGGLRLVDDIKQHSHSPLAVIGGQYYDPI